MVEARCAKCESVIVSLEEIPQPTQGAGDVLLLCCPQCHSVFGVVKARPVEKVFEDAGRQAADFLGKLTERMQQR
jgi:hypothetical protein